MTQPQKNAPIARSLDLKEEYEAQRRSERAGVFVLAARRALQKGEREEAKAQLKQAFAANPGDEKAVDVLGDLYLAEGETEKALELFEKAFARFPGNASFEERAAVCRLDLAEMEADKTVVPLLVETGDKGKVFERSPQKAVSLSVFLPGAGQFYNEENEKGAALLGGYIVSSLCWFYPFSAQFRSANVRKMADLTGMMGHMGSFGTLLFNFGLLISSLIYAYALWDAGTTAAKWNHERRKSLGLEK